jgi:hypothetical protein
MASRRTPPSRERLCWYNMKQRCLNPRNPWHPKYGGRGITICESWRDSFDNFFADMGKCPEKGSLDRIDNNKGYSKENCRWAGMDVQASNRGENQFYNLRGKRITLQELAKRVGRHHSSVWKSLNYYNLTPEEIVDRARRGDRDRRRNRSA